MCVWSGSAGLRVLAWDWVLQAVGFCVVGPQRGIREGGEGARLPGNLAPSWFPLHIVGAGGDASVLATLFR